MLSDLPEEVYRLRLHRLAAVLREFGLVDKAGLGELLRRSQIPSAGTLARRLISSGVNLPPSIPAEYVAKALYAKLTEVDSDTAAWRAAHRKLCCRLETIPPGRIAAQAYHDHIYELLTATFEGYLSNPVKEQSIGQGRGRIDITFDNTAKKGFFANLRKKRIPCDHILFECKNYSDDPKNPEYDQLAGRLDSRRGKIGFLVCRSVKDMARASGHCHDRWNQQKKILFILDDAGISALFGARRMGDHHGLNGCLSGKFRELLM